MEVIAQQLTAFPTVFLTGLGFVVIFYWLFVLLGMFDLDLVDIDFDAPDGGFLGSLAGWLNNWGVGGVPIVITFSFWIIASLAICYIGNSFVVMPLLGTSWLAKGVGFLWLLVSLYFGALIAFVSARPMVPLFTSHSAISKSSLIGSKCVATTLEITDQFGQVSLEDGQAGMILRVRSASKFPIKKGDEVIIIGYDEHNDCFEVVTKAEL